MKINNTGANQDIGSTTQVHSAARATTASRQSPQSISLKSDTTDTVQISSAAKAALQEAMETPAQTAKEAHSGDIQAKKLLAKEEAAKTLKG